MDELLIDEIEKIIEDDIRPQLQVHGGDIEVISFIDSDLKIRLTGNCRNCPSAEITTEDIVEKSLRNKLKNRIGRISLESGVSDDLIDFAKKILNIN